MLRDREIKSSPELHQRFFGRRFKGAARLEFATDDCTLEVRCRRYDPRASIVPTMLLHFLHPGGQMENLERSRKPEPRATQGAVADDCRDAGGTTPGKGEVERSRKPEPRATQGAVAEERGDYMETGDKGMQARRSALAVQFYDPEVKMLRPDERGSEKTSSCRIRDARRW